MLEKGEGGHSRGSSTSPALKASITEAPGRSHSDDKVGGGRSRGRLTSSWLLLPA